MSNYVSKIKYEPFCRISFAHSDPFIASLSCNCMFVMQTLTAYEQTERSKNEKLMNVQREEKEKQVPLNCDPMAMIKK